MIEILVLSPFKHEYGNKSVYLSCGERYTLDPTKPEEKEELKYILADFYPYREFVYYDRTEEVKTLEKEEDDLKLGPLLEDVISPATTEEVADYDDIIQEPEDNIFLAPEVAETLAPEVTNYSEPSPEETFEEEPEVIVTREIRKKELGDLGWKEIKAIIESHNLEYTTKPEAVELILNVEF